MSQALQHPDLLVGGCTWRFSGLHLITTNTRRQAHGTVSNTGRWDGVATRPVNNRWLGGISRIRSGLVLGWTT